MSLAVWTDSQFPSGSYFNWKICLLICFEDELYFVNFLLILKSLLHILTLVYLLARGIFKSNKRLGTVPKLLDSIEGLKLVFFFIKQYK